MKKETLTSPLETFPQLTEQGKSGEVLSEFFGGGYLRNQASENDVAPIFLYLFTPNRFPITNKHLQKIP